MNQLSHTIFAIIMGGALAVSGCSSEDDSFQVIPTSGTAISNPTTQAPDFNSFSIVSEKYAVEALHYEGVTSNITIFVADRHNNPVPDNTEVFFLTNAGRIDQKCFTTNGACVVTWVEQIPLPIEKKAKIIAYTSGEESFTDLNDNDNYDAGEPFTDISEPFFDLDDNGTRDPLLEEFVDADGDNVFDGPDGLFTGTPCVGDTSVCNRISSLIWNSQTLVLSGSWATVSLSGPIPTTIDTTVFLDVTIVDENGNQMPDGTTIAFSSVGGSVDPTAINSSRLDTVYTISFKTGSTAPISDTLKVVVTTPLGNESIYIF